MPFQYQSCWSIYINICSYFLRYYCDKPGTSQYGKFVPFMTIKNAHSFFCCRHKPINSWFRLVWFFFNMRNLENGWIIIFLIFLAKRRFTWCSSNDGRSMLLIAIALTVMGHEILSFLYLWSLLFFNVNEAKQCSFAVKNRWRNDTYRGCFCICTFQCRNSSTGKNKIELKDYSFRFDIPILSVHCVSLKI